jgi:predicted DNA-binding ribbon-helix-helix protein
MASLFHPPVKRSIEIAGHKTSISLEPLFWDLLKQAAVREAVPLNALVARIDAERIVAADPPGLAGAVRLWLAQSLASGARAEGPQPAADQDPG